MTALAFEALSKRYGAFTAVDQASLAVEAGEFVSLLGPSGCGKTTILRMIAGLVEPDGGVIRIGDRDVTWLAPHRRDIGLVFQSYALFPHMSVYENVAFGLRQRRVGDAELDTRVSEALELVRLDGLAQRFPRELSGGQQQRVALARAIAPRPALLLLDEPLSNLDAKLRDTMRIELRLLQRKLGLTTVFVTHDQEEALTMSDRICVMNAGRVQQVGTPRAVYEEPSTPFVAEFFGRANSLDGTVRAPGPMPEIELDDGWRIKVARLPEGVDVNDPVRVTIRRQCAKLTSEPPGEGPNSVHVELQLSSFAGDSVVHVLRLAGGREFTAELPAARGRDLPDAGTRLWLSLDPSDIIVMRR